MANCTLLKCFILLDIALLLSELNSYGSTLKEILLILTKFQINFMHFDHLFVSKQIAIAHLAPTKDFHHDLIYLMLFSAKQ